MTFAAYALWAGEGDSRADLCTGKVFGKPIAVAEAGKDLMALCIEGNRLYAGGGSSFYVFDVSSPMKPKFLGSLSGILSGQGVRQMVVQKGLVYVVARDSGLWIVDVSNPSKPRIRSRFDTTDYGTGVDVAGNVAFVSERNNGVEFVDVSDPDRPEHIAIRRTPESQSVRYSNGYVYSGEWERGQVTVFDVRDMKNIRQVAAPDLWGFGDGVWTKGARLYVSTGHHAKNRDLSTLKYAALDTTKRKLGHMQKLPKEAAGCGHGLHVFDISDPANPVQLGRVDFPPFYESSKDMWTVRTSSGSDVVFCADTFNGLFAVDCADPARPAVVDRWVSPVPKRPELPSCCIGSVAVGRGCVYVAGLGCGLVVLPAKGAAPEGPKAEAGPMNASFRESLPVDTDDYYVWKPKRAGQARAAAVAGKVVYGAFGDAGLHVLRAKKGGGLEKVGELVGHPRVFDVQTDGRRLYTAEGLDGFGIYELDSPVKFREVGRVRQMGGRPCLALCVSIADATRVVFSERNGNGIFYDVSDPSAPRPMNLFGPCASREKYMIDAPLCGGRYFAQVHPYKGKSAKWFDLRSASPRPVKGINFVNPRWAPGICRFDDARAMICYGGGDWLFISPTEDGYDASKLMRLPGKGNRGGIPRKDTNGPYVAMTRHLAREVRLYDFSNEQTPVLVKKWETTGYPDPVVFLDGKLVVPCGHQGLLLMK